jgi:hypothetical protein
MLVRDPISGMELPMARVSVSQSASTGASPAAVSGGTGSNPPAVSQSAGGTNTSPPTVVSQSSGATSSHCIFDRSLLKLQGTHRGVACNICNRAYPKPTRVCSCSMGLMLCSKVRKYQPFFHTECSQKHVHQSLR